MAIKAFKPITPGRRGMTVLDYADVTENRPYKPLTEGKQRTNGRNNRGWITNRFPGGAHKRRYPPIDFRRDKIGIPGKVATIEYDPNRSANIALINYADGEKRYILQPTGLKVGDNILASPEADILNGNALPLRNIPTGTMIHNIEL